MKEREKLGRKHKKDRSSERREKDGFPNSWGNFDFEDDVPFSKNPQLKLKPFSARTESQKQAYQVIKDNTLTFLAGPAGTGKTILPCRVALEYLEKGLIKKIVITRPNIEAGKSLGFMPGGKDEKMLEYLIPIFDNLEIFLGPDKLKQLLEERVVECVPVGFMRGRSFHNTFLIVDEGQNLTKSQFWMILTRIGFDSFGVVTHDSEQIDIKKEDSCVFDIEDVLGYDDIGDFEFGVEDIVRSPIVKTLLQAKADAKERKESGIV